MSYSVFISYRRDGGEGIAHLLYKELSTKGYRVFYDIEKLGQGHFDEHILQEIDQADVFVVILSKSALDRCINEDDWVRREIGHAIGRNKSIIPLFLRGFEFPIPLPADIRSLPTYNGVNMSDMEYFDAKVARLTEMIDEAAADAKGEERIVASKEEQESWYNMAEWLFESGRQQDAFEYYQKAALAGHAGAQFNLGQCYLTGIGAERNESQAVHWFEKAARAGRMDAQFNLGMCYERGRGVGQSIEQAIHWYRKAAEQGDNFARKRWFNLTK